MRPLGASRGCILALTECARQAPWATTLWWHEVLGCYPEFAALTARMDRIEQLLASEHSGVQLLANVLVARGLVTEADLQRVRRP